MNHELKPGQTLEPEDFDRVVRLTPLVSIDLVLKSPDVHANTKAYFIP